MIKNKEMTHVEDLQREIEDLHTEVVLHLTRYWSLNSSSSVFIEKI